MRSVPPRGSGWVSYIAECGLAFVRQLIAFGNWQSTIPGTHPLPRGGTDLIPVLDPRRSHSGIRKVAVVWQRRQSLKARSPPKERRPLWQVRHVLPRVEIKCSLAAG